MKKPSHFRRSKLRVGLTVAPVMATALSLCACSSNTDRIVNLAPLSNDYRERHPIALVEAPRKLDVFVDRDTGKLSLRSADQIREFASNARESALAPIVMLVPRGTGHDATMQAAIPSIRRALVSGGAAGYVNVGSYPVADRQLASPIRLSFETVKAKVASQCGQWPRDLASGSTVDGWQNRPYWNYGCAYQSNLAAQVDDPRDLVQARAEEPSDVEMRMRAIGNVRKGTDPGTNWVVKNSNLGAAGGD